MVIQVVLFELPFNENSTAFLSIELFDFISLSSFFLFYISILNPKKCAFNSFDRIVLFSYKKVKKSAKNKKHVKFYGIICLYVEIYADMFVYFDYAKCYNQNGDELMNIDYERIGFRIAQRRRELKLKQRQLAELVGVSNKYISNLETGTRHVNLEMLSKLCDALDVTPDYFLLGSIKKEPGKNLTDKIQLCSPENQRIISDIVEIFTTK